MSIDIILKRTRGQEEDLKTRLCPIAAQRSRDDVISCHMYMYNGAIRVYMIILYQLRCVLWVNEP